MLRNGMSLRETVTRENAEMISTNVEEEQRRDASRCDPHASGPGAIRAGGP
jgi:hypothetical protein